MIVKYIFILAIANDFFHKMIRDNLSSGLDPLCLDVIHVSLEASSSDMVCCLDRVKSNSRKSRRKSASLVFSKRPLQVFEKTSGEKKEKKRLVQQKLPFTSSCSKSRPRGGNVS